jgi:SAM-dependent methyltransferase
LEPTYSAAWFETFGRPDEATTAREVDFLAQVLPPPPATVLDVPCGVGRHARALAAGGYAVTGVERDPAAAAEARAGGIEVHELDVRRLDALPGTFDAVICMWASFGWHSDGTNAEVFAAMAAKADRALVLDVYDPAFFRARQGTTDNRGVLEHKRVDGNRLLTRLEYPDGSLDAFEWRLYEPEELEALGAAAGLRLDAVGTGFSEAPPTGDAPRAQYVFLRET